ncbi:hypothetical protein SPRG_22291 [Saprolegnia parasitica CBS 223.65]|uniref:RING-type E3 ubiquitin transferase n=1 Tax=Saprolegnia parasitica (strain CBS 223.65) TaxID=695850 RepID=A0A067C7G2_SAPPC|nr:hypothetical protein SPRG_22291 [Saprolegnia parasitica CBS 223.65]KDO22722.1 hypothetical protein SPRG_22291 [Saprolegnia parasitica CBS 223.65]|eukprot:XP_012206569.1 hypothetical protein SPRG_22291 [Saprolegnia parasitica CBS 223.65]
MANRDGVVLLYTASPGGTLNGPGNMHVLNREEQESQMDIERGRLQRLLSTTIFVCFFILFLDGTNRSQRFAKKTASHQNTQWPYTDNDTERATQIAYFQHLLGLEMAAVQPLGQMNKSENVSGIYSGLWAPLQAADYKTQAAANEVGRRVHPQIQPYAQYDANLNPYTADVASFSPGGVFWLVLTIKATPVAEMNDDVAYVTGQVIMHDKQSTLAMTMFNVQGVFLRRIGRLTLYGNLPDARVELIYLLLRQLQLSSTQAMAAKVSLLTVGAQAIVDSYLCLAHLTVGIVAQQIFTLFATVSFFELIIFSIFEMRYLLVIWKARRPQNFTQGWLLMRRELTTLYSRFYISLLTGLCLIYYAWHYLNVLVLLAFSFWVPQIVHNAHREVRNPFDWVYMLGMSVSRLFLPLYFYGCPSNFLSALPVYQMQVQPGMCYLLVGWVALQIAVLLLQQRCGPRFFVPARFLPVKYNYERRINADQMSLLRANHGDEIDCVICMVELDMDARDYMIAPCDHIFHRPCLQEWMHVKMECPTCRCALPEP